MYVKRLLLLLLLLLPLLSTTTTMYYHSTAKSTTKSTKLLNKFVVEQINSCPTFSTTHATYTDRAADMHKEVIKKKRRDLEQASLDAASDLLDTDSNATFAMVLKKKSVLFSRSLSIFLFFNIPNLLLLL